MDPNNIRDAARFTLEKVGAAFYKFHIQYREVDVRILFPRGDEGRQELANLSGTIARLMGVALRESKVREEMQNIDTEIEGLLGGADE
jgi:hypothetical protein